MSRDTSTQAISVNNVGTFDRVLRLLLAVTMLAPAFVTSTETLGWLSLAVLAAIYPATTAVIGWDPVYHALDLSTVRTRPEPAGAAQVAEALVRRYHGEGITNGVDANVSRSAAANNPPPDRRAA